jgi:hypothetical protein
MFPYIGNFIIPTDELIFFRGVGQPPTRYTFMLRGPLLFQSVKSSGKVFGPGRIEHVSQELMVDLP